MPIGMEADVDRLPSDSAVSIVGLTDQCFCFYVGFQEFLSPSAAASKPFDHLDRGPPRQGIAVYGVASLLPPAQTPAASVIVVAAALAHPAPAVASPGERVPVPAETNSQRLFEASQCSLQNGL